MGRHTESLPGTRIGTQTLILFAAISLLLISPLAASATVTINDWSLPSGTYTPLPRQMLERGGDIWLPDEWNNKLLKFDPVTEAFSEFTLPYANMRPLGLAEDLSGKFWMTGFGSGNKKIIQFDPVTETFSDEAPIGISGFMLSRDTSGNIWYVGNTTETGYADGYIGRFDPVTKDATAWAHPSGLDLDYGFIASDGRYWYSGSAGWEPGFGVFDPGSEVFTDISADPWSVSLEDGAHIWMIDSPGNRIGKFDTASNTFTATYTMPTENSSPRGIVQKDASGKLWLSERAGNNIVSFDPTTSAFTEYPVPTVNGQPQYVLPVGNRVWFGERQAGKLGVLELGSTSDTTAPINHPFN